MRRIIKEGWIANVAGRAESDNPYPAGSPEACWWFNGWEASELSDDCWE